MSTNEIRRLIKVSGMKHWLLAEKLGISEATLVRWLRKDRLPENTQQKILGILAEAERR